ncbi:MAG: hypothetical protein OXP09_11020 [Gammaproteobacteria bacterium]|nr:hypothetical protein [Gammaproteobacteria bacterium]MDE0366090.1 hypothetical protein [Gammaproteobacteria bacterium]
MIGGLLVDTGFFFALRDSRDQHHASANARKHLLDRSRIVLPWLDTVASVCTTFTPN